MSETLRDLVVSLSLNSDNFTRNGKQQRCVSGRVSGHDGGEIPRGRNDV